MNKENELCTIIVPIYNVEKYLRRCIDSIIQQTYKNLEIILVDDGSTDSCPNICDDYASKDVRIKTIHKTNGGLSDARNAGLDIALGKYIMFVDSDDYIDLSMCEKLYKSIKQNNSDIVMCGINYVYDNNVIYKLKEINLPKCNAQNICDFYTLSGKKIKNNEIITENIMGTVCRALYSKESISNIRFEKGMFCEDLLFSISVINANIKISIVNEFLYFYYQRSGSIIHSFNKARYEKRIQFTRRVLQLLKERVSSSLYDAYKFQLYLVMLNELCISGDKVLLNDFVNSELFKELNCRENYLSKQKITKLIPYKVANFLAYKKMFGVYSLMIKIFKK